MGLDGSGTTLGEHWEPVDELDVLLAKLKPGSKFIIADPYASFMADRMALMRETKQILIRLGRGQSIQVRAAASPFWLSTQCLPGSSRAFLQPASPPALQPAPPQEVAPTALPPPCCLLPSPCHPALPLSRR